jgi:hypothetical protein
MEEPRVSGARLTAPVVLREIRRDRGSTILAAVIVPLAAGAVVIAVTWATLSAPHDRRDLASLLTLWLLFLWVVLVPVAWILHRVVRGGPDVRLDSWGIVWGDDRRRHLSLDWTAVSRVRAWPNPVRLGDAGILVFDSEVEPGPRPVPGRLVGQIVRAKRAEFGTPFVISTWSTDITFSELCAIVEAHVSASALPSPGVL